MAFPWSANDILTAADLNAAFGGSSYATYTPTLTQSGSVTNTINRAAYARIGKSVHGGAYLTVTGTGTLNNIVLVGLPVAAVGSQFAIGSGTVFDTSAGLFYSGTLILNSSTTAKLSVGTTGTNYLGGSGGVFTAALAAGDLVAVAFDYEAA